MHFYEVLRLLHELPYGTRFARTGWNGKGLWIRLVGPHDGDASRSPRYMVRAFIEMKDAQDWLVPWLASQTDLLADDWIELT